MLSSVLNSAKAIQVNIQIVRVFAKVRQMLTGHAELKLKIEEIKKNLHNQSQNIEVVFRYLDELLDKQEKPAVRKRIGFMPDDL